MGRLTSPDTLRGEAPGSQPRRHPSAEPRQLHAVVRRYPARRAARARDFGGEVFGFLRMMPTSARSASLTAAASGKNGARSRSTTTIGAPASRAAYELRRPRRKSYSGRMSTGPGRGGRVRGVFFIGGTFATGSPSGADESDTVGPFSKHNRKEAAVLGQAEDCEPLLPVGMARVGNDASLGVTEDSDGLFEGDPVLDAVGRGLPGVPLKLWDYRAST